MDTLHKQLFGLVDKFRGVASINEIVDGCCVRIIIEHLLVNNFNDFNAWFESILIQSQGGSLTFDKENPSAYANLAQLIEHHELSDFGKFNCLKPIGSSLLRFSDLESGLWKAISQFVSEVFEDDGRPSLRPGEFEEILIKFGRPIEVLTTPHIVRALMVRLGNPQGGQRVYDPCLGSGGLLTDAVEHSKQYSSSTIEVFGRELSSTTYVTALTRFILNGIDFSNLTCGNSLIHAPTYGSEFDLVLCSPPFGSKLSKEDAEQLAIPGRDKVSAFLMNAIDSLNENGRAVFLVPWGFMFRRDVMGLRETLLTENTLEAVVALPAQALKPYTSINSAILVLRKGGTTEKVRMVDATTLFSVGHSSNSRKTLLGNSSYINDIKKSVDCHTPDENGWDVSFSRLEELEFNLVPFRHDPRGLEHCLENKFADSDLQISSDVLVHVETSNRYRSSSAGLVTATAIPQADLTCFKAEEFFSISTLEKRMHVVDLGNQFFEGKDEKISSLRSHIERVLKPMKEARADDTIYEDYAFNVAVIDDGDLKSSQLNNGTELLPVNYLSADALIKVNVKYVLADGDILFSHNLKNSCVYRSSVGPAVAGKRIFVLRLKLESVLPEYLVAILKSEEYMDYLLAIMNSFTQSGRISQRSIRHFQKALDLIRIPIPSPAIQRQVVEEFKDQNAFMILMQLLEIETEGVYERWLRRVSQELLNVDTADLKVAEVIKLFQSLYNRLHQLVDELESKGVDGVDNDDRSNDLASQRSFDWLWGGNGFPFINELIYTLSPLINVNYEISSGDLYIRAQKTKLNVLRLLEIVVDDKNNEMLPLERKIVRHVARWADEIGGVIERDIKISIGPISLSAPDDGPYRSAEVNFRVTNEGALPIYRANFNINGANTFGGHVVSNLAAGDSCDLICLTMFDEEFGDRNLLTIEWKAYSIGDAVVVGQRELPFVGAIPSLANAWQVDPTPATKTQKMMENPYVLGTPVTPKYEKVFKGRAQDLKEISDHLEGGKNVVILEGNRRSGKSSILAHLRGASDEKGWLGTLCDLQHSTVETDQNGGEFLNLFREMATSIAKDVHGQFEEGTPLPNGTVHENEQSKAGISKACTQGIRDESTLRDFVDYLELIIERLRGEELSLVVMFDEFDKVFKKNLTITPAGALENLRAIIQSQDNFTVVFAGAKRLKSESLDYDSVFYGLGKPFSVSAIAESDARALIREPVSEFLEYSEAAVEYIVEQTACMPYLIQHYCHEVFQLAIQQNIVAATIEDAKTVVDKLLDAVNGVFSSLWKEVGNCRRQLIIALSIETTDGDLDPITFEFLREKLSEYRIPFSDDDLDEDIEFLIDLEVLVSSDELQDKRYHLRVPLFAKWVTQNQDRDSIIRRAGEEVAK